MAEKGKGFAAVLAVMVVLLAVFVWAFVNRYELATGAGGGDVEVYLLDHWSGEMWAIRGNAKTAVMLVE